MKEVEMKNVLVAVDGSDRSLAALREVLRHADAIARIDLVNVQPRLNRHISRWIGRSQRDAWRAERSATALGPARRLVELCGIPVRTHVALGEADAALRDTAERLGSDEVVTAPRSKVERIAVPAGLGLIALLLLADE
jgi:nucleotide-binding universal stress UspA family protein